MPTGEAHPPSSDCSSAATVASPLSPSDRVPGGAGGSRSRGSSRVSPSLLRNERRCPRVPQGEQHQKEPETPWLCCSPAWLPPLPPQLQPVLSECLPCLGSTPFPWDVLGSPLLSAGPTAQPLTEMNAFSGRRSVRGSRKRGEARWMRPRAGQPESCAGRRSYPSRHRSRLVKIPAVGLRRSSSHSLSKRLAFPPPLLFSRV